MKDLSFLLSLTSVCLILMSNMVLAACVNNAMYNPTSDAQPVTLVLGTTVSYPSCDIHYRIFKDGTPGSKSSVGANTDINLTWPSFLLTPELNKGNVVGYPQIIQFMVTNCNAIPPSAAIKLTLDANNQLDSTTFPSKTALKTTVDSGPIITQLFDIWVKNYGEKETLPSSQTQITTIAFNTATSKYVWSQPKPGQGKTSYYNIGFQPVLIKDIRDHYPTNTQDSKADSSLDFVFTYS